MFTRQRQQGSTLIDVCAACVMGSITMALALPSYHSWQERDRRADAVSALQRVQQAQAEYHAAHGRYALRLDALGTRIAPYSDQGLYRISMFSEAPDSFEVHAAALSERAQARDASCSQVTLRVTAGVIAYEPSPLCWNP
ncbi:MAG: type IV pilin protein [Burkholderiaceae bacterium]